MKGPRWLLSAVLIPAISACSGGGGGGGGGDPYEGLYQTAGFTSNFDGCDAEGPAETYSDPYFRFVDENFFGTRILAYYACTTADDCDDSVLVNKSFEDREGGTWTQSIGYVSWSSIDSYCAITEEFVTLDGDPDPETGIAITTTFSSTTDGSISQSDCEVDFDELLPFVHGYRDQFTCDRLEVLRADRVAE